MVYLNNWKSIEAKNGIKKNPKQNRNKKPQYSVDVICSKWAKTKNHCYSRFYWFLIDKMINGLINSALLSSCNVFAPQQMLLECLVQTIGKRKKKCSRLTLIQGEKIIILLQMQWKHLVMSTVISCQADSCKSKMLNSVFTRMSPHPVSIWENRHAGVIQWVTRLAVVRTGRRTHTHAHTQIRRGLSLHKHSTCVWRRFRLRCQIEPRCHAEMIRASFYNLPPLSFLHTSLR